MVLACLAIALFCRARGLVPESDRDTFFILSAIKQRANTFSWFTTDWPLQNGFYRPITVLSFAIDIALSRGGLYDYGLSAVFYCALCILAVFWLARELTNSPPVATASALLFALWQTPIEVHWDWICWTLAFLILLVGVARHRLHVARYLPAVLAVAFVATELRGVHLREAPSGFYIGVLHWIPSRTATLMTLFALSSMAAYARYLRKGTINSAANISPLDLPATRTSTENTTETKGTILWLIGSFLLALLALGSYEQAVMLPVVLFVVGLIFHFKGHPVKWQWQLVFWAEVLAYLLVRRAILPATISEYANQQLRVGLTALLSELNYVLPCSVYAGGWIKQFALGTTVLMVGLFWSFPLQVASNAAAYIGAFRQNRVVMLMWLCSIFAFLPMAFLKPFSHYHYWAMSLRSIFVVLLIAAVWKMVLSAVSLPAVQAPQRSSPAPGSLPHR